MMNSNLSIHNIVWLEQTFEFFLFILFTFNERTSTYYRLLHENISEKIERWQFIVRPRIAQTMVDIDNIFSSNRIGSIVG